MKKTKPTSERKAAVTLEEWRDAITKDAKHMRGWIAEVRDANATLRDCVVSWQEDGER